MHCCSPSNIERDTRFEETATAGNGDEIRELKQELKRMQEKTFQIRGTELQVFMYVCCLVQNFQFYFLWQPTMNTDVSRTFFTSLEREVDDKTITSMHIDERLL